MNDVDKLKKVFDEIGVEYVLNSHKQNISTQEYNYTITLDYGLGYSGFYCQFYFLNGKYLGHGVWE